jgi:rsbT antagonist protein RsbS
MPEERIPIIHLRDLLLVSVQVELSDRVVLQLKEDITREVARSRVRGLIVDLTGVDFMDSYISRTLRDISIMTSLMGVPTVLCGMHAVIAMTMTEMGIELGGLSMSLNLDAALRMFRSTDQDHDVAAPGRDRAPSLPGDEDLVVIEAGDHGDFEVVF